MTMWTPGMNKMEKKQKKRAARNFGCHEKKDTGNTYPIHLGRVVEGER